MTDCLVLTAERADDAFDTLMGGSAADLSDSYDVLKTLLEVSEPFHAAQTQLGP